VTLAVSLAGCRGGARAGSGERGGAASDDPSSPALVEIDLTRGAPEQRPAKLFGTQHGSTFGDLLTVLERVEDDNRASGVFLRFGGTRLGWARGSELGRVLTRLREHGKRVECHADELGNATYGVAARGCDRIWLSPAGGIETVGIAAEMVFARDLLDKIGVKADVLQVGKYKGTGETATRSSASDEMKQSVGGVLADLRALWREGLDEGRRAGIRAAVEGGPYSADRAKELGMVDELGYVDEARDAARREAHAGRVDARFGGKRGSSGFVEMVRELSGATRSVGGGGDYVAVIRASGAIAMERGGGILGEQAGIAVKPLTKALREIVDDDAAKAIVLRIDSPGGSALASDLLWHELMRVRKVKPLIVSIGDMAASGGYYMACAGTRIVAEPTSIVGSIGVVGGKLAFGPALAPFGVHVETLPADPAATGSRASYSSALTPWDDATRTQVLASMTSIYELFVRRVVEGRSMPIERVRPFTEGRIFTGRQGKELGMIDELGGVERAVEMARTEAHLSSDAGLRVVDEEGGFFEALGLSDGFDDEALAPSAGEVAVVAAVRELGRSVPELGVFAASMAPLLSGERALVAVPFAFLIRLFAAGHC
jgi:protease-4